MPMCADNATNDARKAAAEERVLTAVATLRSHNEELGIRVIARLAGASALTVRKLRHLWQSDINGITTGKEVRKDYDQWKSRLEPFQPHTVEEYLHSVWPDPVTPDTIARWYAQMSYLRQLYRTSAIHLAPTTYRLFADWVNSVMDDARQRFTPQLLMDALDKWQGDPVETLLADGAIAGVKLPTTVKDTLQTMCLHGTTTTADASSINP